MPIDPRKIVLLCIALWMPAALSSQETATAQQPLFGVSPPRAPEPDPPCPLCQTVKRQVEQGCVPPGDYPYADLAVLRQPGTVDFPDSVMSDLALARMSSDPTETASRLSGYLTDPSADIRYVAGLLIVMTYLQTGQSSDSGQAARAMAAVEAAMAEGLSFVPSDAAFIEAFEARQKGDLRTARDAIWKAIDMEPRFFAALALALDLAITRSLDVGNQSRALCTDAYNDLISVLVGITDLSPCRYQAAHLDLYISRKFAAPDTMAPVNLARVYLGIIAQRPAATQLARDRFAGTSGLACKATQLATLDRLIAATLPDEAQE